MISTDTSFEFGKACEDLSWNHCTSTPHRSETNGIAERGVRIVKEGTSAVLLQSGLNESWWADSMEWYTFLRNVTDLFSDGKTPYERRFWATIWRTDCSIRFIGLVSPIPAKSDLCGSLNTLCTWGEFRRVTMVVDIEELETMDTQFEEKVKEIFLKGLHNHYLKTHFRMPVKIWMTSGSCQETSFTAITLNSRVKLYSPREE